MNAKRDNNHIPVALGESTTGGVLPWMIDHVTGRLLLLVDGQEAISGSLNIDRALRDDNFSTTMTGVADDGSGLLAVAADSVTGLPIVDMLIE